MTRQRALTYIHIAAVLFGLTGVFGELIQAGAVVITMGRAVFAVAALGLFARMRRRPLLGALTPAQLFVLVISGALLAAHWVTFFVSVKVGGIAIATLGFASFPAFITLFEGPDLPRARAAGRMVAAGPGHRRPGAGDAVLRPGRPGHRRPGLGPAVRPDLRPAGPEQPPFSLRHGSDAGRLLAEPGGGPGDAALRGGALPSVAAVDWLWLALLGVFCTGLSHYLFVSSLTRLNARSAGLVIALEPVYAIAFAWALFSQQPTPRMLAGAALIVAAIVWSGLRGGRGLRTYRTVTALTITD